MCVCVFATFIVCWKARLITFSFQSHFLVVEVFNAIVICRFQWCAALKKASERERKRMKERESERENYFWKKKRIRGRDRERERARSWCILFYHFGCHYSDFFRIVRVEYAFFRIVCVCVRHPLFFSHFLALFHMNCLSFHSLSLFIVWFYFSIETMRNIHEWFTFYFSVFKKRTNERGDNNDAEESRIRASARLFRGNNDERMNEYNM